MDCLLCKHQQNDEFCKRKRKNISEITITDCHWYEESLYIKFRNFINNEWDDKEVYMTTDFIDRFGISRHLARHYLFDVFTRNEKLLFRVKQYNKAYYFKRIPERVKEVNAYKFTRIKIEM